ncbi:MAG TPA: DUF3999 domain-containing protein [Burkholderiales bacterium]|nr:DUF3999 domain-containing protein [Burkholderiales bacterium]
MNLRLFAVLPWLAVPGAMAADSPADFAFAVPIEGVGNNALYRVVIAPAVYEGSAYADLRDLRVFNGAGEVVPHAFRPPAPATHKPEPVPLPFFAMRGPRNAAPEDLDIAFDAEKGRISLRAKSRKKQDAHTALLGFLVDLSARKETFSGLALDWETTPEGYVGAVRVEASEDLKRWTPLAVDAPLVRLIQGGQRLEQKSVALRPLRTKYLRLTWPAGASVPQLTSLSGLPAEAVTAPARAWKEVSAHPDSREPGDYRADLGGVFPADRLEIRLPQDNTVAPLQIFSRDRPSAEWTPVARTVAYRLRQNGREIVSPAVTLAPNARRYWLLRVDQQGGGIGQGAMRLKAGWIAREIVFAARGPGPFRLAFGNARAQPNALPIETLVPGWGSETAPQIASATTGAVQTLAGESAARQHVDMKKASLWAALLAGVALLGLMAWRISKQLQSRD